jgi:aldehyde:ferredoxin oxidoreductase
MAFRKFIPNKKDMLATAIKLNGNISALADHYKVCRNTIYEYLKRDPDGKEIIEKVRGVNEETILDAAEHVLRYNLMNYKLNPAIAQRAAEKVIDRKGHLRGWVSSPIESKIEEATEANFQSVMQMLKEYQSDSTIKDISTST